MNAEKKYRVGFLTTHPIQYQVPLFQRLARMPDIDLTVYYCMIPTPDQQGAEFGVKFSWDLPLLEGYQHQVLKNVARQPDLMKFNGCNTPEIVRIIGEGKFDAFLVNGWNVWSCLQALWGCRWHGVPCIVRGEANVLRERAGWKSWLHRQLVRQYSAYLVIGKSNAEFYRRLGGNPDRFFPAWYCVDNDRFGAAADATRPRRAEIRRNWKIPADAVTYLYCGKLIPKKHPVELLKAFADACRRNSKLHLLMVGTGELQSECETLIRDQQLPVTMAGFLNQSTLPEAYVAADALVLPSDTGETWGLVTNEAMASGLPAIVSDQAGCAEDLIIENVTGSVFRFGHWSQLTELLLRWAENPISLKHAGVAARKLIERYSMDAAAEGMAQAIRAVGRRKSPVPPS